jgi:hypothetical protein
MCHSGTRLPGKAGRLGLGCRRSSGGVPVGVTRGGRPRNTARAMFVFPLAERGGLQQAINGYTGFILCCVPREPAAERAGRGAEGALRFEGSGAARRDGGRRASSEHSCSRAACRAGRRAGVTGVKPQRTTWSPKISCGVSRNDRWRGQFSIHRHRVTDGACGCGGGAATCGTARTAPRHAGVRLGETRARTRPIR